MFKIYVRPILEYNSSCWSPFLLKDIDLIEGIQRSFTRRIPGFSNYSYNERLQLCGLESLKLRRIKEDMILIYKMIHGLIDSEFSDFFQFAHSECTRGHAFKLYPGHRSTDLTLCSFSSRVVNVWNALPDAFVGARSINTFKTLLDENENFLTKYLRGRATK